MSSRRSRKARRRLQKPNKGEGPKKPNQAFDPPSEPSSSPVHSGEEIQKASQAEANNGGQEVGSPSRTSLFINYAVTIGIAVVAAIVTAQQFFFNKFTDLENRTARLEQQRTQSEEKLLILVRAHLRLGLSNQDEFSLLCESIGDYHFNEQTCVLPNGDSVKFRALPEKLEPAQKD
jgi:hypothetical protein